MQIFLGVRSRNNEAESESDTERKSGEQSAYDYYNITNTEDFLIREDLERAQDEVFNVSGNVQFNPILFIKIHFQFRNEFEVIYLPISCSISRLYFCINYNFVVFCLFVFEFLLCMTFA